MKTIYMEKFPKVDRISTQQSKNSMKNMDLAQCPYLSKE